MNIMHILALSILSLTFGCMKDSKPSFNDAEQEIIKTAKDVLKNNEILPQKYPTVDVSSLDDMWIVIFSESFPHPPGTDITVHISKKDGTTSLLRGE